MFIQTAAQHAAHLLRLYTRELSNIGLFAIFLFLYFFLHTQNNSVLGIFGSNNSTPVFLGAWTLCILLLCASIFYHTLRMNKTTTTINH